MEYVHLEKNDSIAVITLRKDKVNPLNEQVVDELAVAFQSAIDDRDLGAIIFTGSGKFFSFGFEIPELYHYGKKDFAGFLVKFTNLYNLVFTSTKPIIAAINGHAIAGGCMLAIACDYRIMVTGKPKISLNEITFGSSVFAGATEILKYVVGSRNAEELLTTGAMYTAEDAKSLGLIDETVSQDELLTRAIDIAKNCASKDSTAFASIKQLLRQDVIDKIAKYEQNSIREFNDIWYSESTRAQTKKIVIR
jgi:3,2-trans-enoyl-CoA isomerase